MALDFQKVQIPFGQGLAQERAPALVSAGKLAVAENAVIAKDGSIQPRPGTSNLGVLKYGGGVISAARHVVADGRSTVVTTPYRALSYQDTDDRWRDADEAYEADIRRVIAGGRNHDGAAGGNFDIGYSADWIVVAWYDTSTYAFYVKFIDYETEALTATETWTCEQGSVCIRVVVCGTYVYVVYHDLSNRVIKAAQWDITDVESGATHSTIGSDADDDGEFDAVGVGSHFYCVYKYDEGGGVVGSQVIRADCDLGNLTVKYLEFRNDGLGGVYESACYGIDVDTGDTIYVSYGVYKSTTEFGVDTFGLDDDATMAVGYSVRNIVVTRTARRIGVVATTGSAYTVWDVPIEGFDTERYLVAASMTSAGVTAVRHLTYHVGLLSRPWLHNGDLYCCGFVSQRMTVAYGSVDTHVWQRNAYVLQLRLGTYEEIKE